MRFWTTDASRYTTGLAWCQMKRYYEYHLFGYGVRRSLKDVEPSLGKAVHSGLEVALAADDWEKASLTSYENFISEAAGGFSVDAELPTADEKSTFYGEQGALSQALVTGFGRYISQPREIYSAAGNPLGDRRLPISGEVVATEQEYAIRVADNIVIPIRIDLLTLEESGNLTLHDYKTQAYMQDLEEWADSIQLHLYARVASENLKDPVTSYRIHQLVKGARRPAYDPATGDYDGPKSTNSPLIYGYVRAGSPPLVEDDWQPTWRWVDATGKKRTLGKAYEKVPIWERFPGGIDAWVKALPDEVIEKQFKTSAYIYDGARIDQLFRALIPHETQWQMRTAFLHDVLIRTGWESDEFQETLDATVPRSYQCWNYGRRCQFYALCFKESGWKELTGYESRVPHHTIELNQKADEEQKAMENLNG